MKLPQFIDTNEQLAELMRSIAGAEAVAVDTEFVWMRTYFPQLGIIQLAVSRDEAFIIDCVTITDTAPLKEMLENPAVVKIFHDAHQDITIINKYAACQVHSVFDTQRAAGFTGRSRTLSLEKLIRENTGTALAKSETRTNWLKRPLDPEQIEYALDDVRYLPEVRLQLIAEAERLGNREFLQQEMEQFDHIVPFDAAESTEKQFRKTAGRIPARGRNRAWRLVVWQENEARRRDIPREHLIKKEVLADLALSEASTVEEISALGIIGSKTMERYGEQIAAVLAGDECPSKELVKSLQKPGSDSNEMSALIQIFHSFCSSAAVNRGIDPALLFNKSDVSDIVRKFVKNRFFTPLPGWRGWLLNQPAELFLAGKLNLSYTIPEETTNEPTKGANDE